MATRIRVIFNRKKTATRSIAAPVSIEVYHDRGRKYFSTGISLKAHEWDKTRGEVVNRSDMIELNKSLSLQYRKVLDAVNSIREEGEQFSFELLTDMIEGKKAKEGSFLDFLEERIEKRNIASSTRRQHNVLLSVLKDFGGINFFSDLTTKNIKLFDDYIKENHSKHQVTVHGYHRRLKVYVNEAVEFGHIQASPYNRFKVEAGKSKGLKYLTKDELRSIEDKEIRDAVLCRVRDVFVFCCYTGLAYSDLAKFDFSNAVKEGSDYYIIDTRKKTDETYYIMLLPKAIAVLQKYEYKLPIMTNEKYNFFLKALAGYVGINKNLTSHVARHTFATTITLSNNVPIEIVARMLGHTKIETTQRYAKVLAEDVKDQFRRLKDKLQEG